MMCFAILIPILIWVQLGMRASSMATLFFEDVVIPKKNLLGVEGGGLIHMMRNLEVSFYLEVNQCASLTCLYVCVD